MFVIVYNNSVILGPMRWNKFRFENEILEECEVTKSLPNKNEDQVITVSENIKIYPVQGSPNPQFNPIIEHLNGPFWEFTETHAISSYQVQSLPIDAVKNTLKSETATERYSREIAGIKITIQETEVTIDTNRGDRDIFVQKFLLMSESDTVQWKFPEGWLTLSKTELGTIVSAGSNHVQSQFDWEATKIAEIDACETLEQLSEIVIRQPNEMMPWV
jgi:hypothetical protein